jgi:S-formylglutathione hydrolase FrmB
MGVPGAVAFGALVAAGTLAAAQSLPSSTPSWEAAAAVSGTSSCSDVRVTHLEQGPPITAGVEMRCEETVSDPRVSGPSTMTIDTEGAIAWTRHTITGPDGSWAGLGYGLYDTDDVLRATAMLVGSGAYEGWTYVYEAMIPSVDAPLPVTIVGYVQPGSPAPLYPVLVEASPSPSPARGPIGRIADDGAGMIAIETVDARTRDLTIGSPAVGVVKVRLLLPAAYASQPSTRWPVLYLLQGAMDDYTSWSTESTIEELTEPTDLLVVMPAATQDGVDGWYTDWYNGGAGGPPRWETFHLVELLQLLERNWQAGDRRAVAGLSMGGYGAITYAARHPGMFAAAASFSGVLDLKVDPGDFSSPTDIARWGEPGTASWTAHDPIQLVRHLQGTLLYVAYGDGTPGPLDAANTSTDGVESWIAAGNERFVAALKDAGLPATVHAYGPGTHSWPYWQREMHAFLPMMLEALADRPDASSGGASVVDG